MKKLNLLNLSKLLIVFISLNSFSQSALNKVLKHDISNNLDLRAVASIFGESKSVEDFEFRLNHPSMQISNLDLNNDLKVDFLRIIETIHNNSNLIVLQAILDKDTFQDVATIELNNINNKIEMQIKGNTYFYGNNFIYEPIYETTPLIFDKLLTQTYIVYSPKWNWKFYPEYFKSWETLLLYRFVKNINSFIGYNNVCNYTNQRKNQDLANIYEKIKNNHYEKLYPTKSFNDRNKNIGNIYELSQLVIENKTKNKNLISNPKTLLNK